MRQILHDEPATEIVRKADFAANVALSNFWVNIDDVVDNLDDVLAKKENSTLVEPRDLLAALNNTGWLNSFLQETDGSAEILLQGLEGLFNHMDYTHSCATSKGYRYISQDEEGYATANIQAADYIKSVVEANKIMRVTKTPKETAKALEKNSHLLQQEEDLSKSALKDLDTLADEIFCQTVLSETQYKEHASPEDTTIKLFPDLSHNSANNVSLATLTRRFQVQCLTKELAKAMNASKHYRINSDQLSLFVEYLSNVLQKRKKNLDNDVDSEQAIDLHKALQTLEVIHEVLPKEIEQQR